MSSGIIIVKKETGYTSFDVVAKLRGILHQRKIGHTGTLDPDATGVLPVCIGSATKVCQFLTDSDKEYKACMLLGITTDTQDISGQILEQNPVTVEEQKIEQMIEEFVGDYQQVPPMYSALKVNGKKLCDLARKGVTVEREPRNVKLYAIKVDAIKLPRVYITVGCSKGTYIRTLIHDIGKKLGCGACMESLQRTKAAGFQLEEAHDLGQIEAIVKEGHISQILLPVDSLFPEYGKIQVDVEADLFLHNGNKIAITQMDEKPATDYIRIYDSKGTFSGIYQKADDLFYKPLKMFLDKD